MSSSPSSVVCGLCDEAPAVVRCADCPASASAFCADCDAALHSPKKMQSHQRSALTSPAPPTCEVCDAAPASLHCPACGLHLCQVSGCDEAIHKPASKRSHVRSPIASSSSPQKPPSSAPLPALSSVAPPSPSPSAPTAPSPAFPVCTVCEAALPAGAAVDCAQCSALFCVGCDAEFHAPAKMRGHTRRGPSSSVAPPPPPPQWQAAPPPPPSSLPLPSTLPLMSSSASSRLSATQALLSSLKANPALSSPPPPSAGSPSPTAVPATGRLSLLRSAGPGTGVAALSGGVGVGLSSASPFISAVAASGRRVTAPLGSSAASPSPLSLAAALQARRDTAAAASALPSASTHSHSRLQSSPNLSTALPQTAPLPLTPATPSSTTSPGPAPPPPSEVPLLCSVCDSAAATFRCVDCAAVFCSAEGGGGCLEALHQPKRMQGHLHVRLQGEGAAQEEERPVRPARPAQQPPTPVTASPPPTAPITAELLPAPAPPAMPRRPTVTSATAPLVVGSLSSAPPRSSGASLDAGAGGVESFSTYSSIITRLSGLEAALKATEEQRSEAEERRHSSATQMGADLTDLRQLLKATHQLLQDIHSRPAMDAPIPAAALEQPQRWMSVAFSAPAPSPASPSAEAAVSLSPSSAEEPIGKGLSPPSSSAEPTVSSTGPPPQSSTSPEEPSGDSGSRAPPAPLAPPPPTASAAPSPSVPQTAAEGPVAGSASPPPPSVSAEIQTSSLALPSRWLHGGSTAASAGTAAALVGAIDFVALASAASAQPLPSLPSHAASLSPSPAFAALLEAFRAQARAAAKWRRGQSGGDQQRPRPRPTTAATKAVEEKRSGEEAKGWDSKALHDEWREDEVVEEEEGDVGGGGTAQSLPSSHAPIRGYSATAFAVYTPELRPSLQWRS